MYSVSSDFVASIPAGSRVVAEASVLVPLAVSESVTNLVSNPSMEAASGAVTVRTNLVTNPSFEVNTTGWTGGTRDTSEKYVGAASAKVAAGAQYAAIDTTISIPTPSTSYVLSAWVKGEVGKKVTIEFDGRNAGGTRITTATAISYTMTGVWQRITVSRTMEATAVSTKVYIFNNTAGAHTFYVDAVQLEVGSTASDYFDGSTAASGDFTYAWSGTAHASTSLQQGVGVTGFGGGPVVQSSVRSHTGSKSVRFIETLTILPSERGPRWNTSGFTVGKTYTAMAYVYQPVSSTLRLAVRNPNTGAWATGPTTTTANDWVKLSVTWTASAASENISIGFMSHVAAGKELWADDLIIVEGTYTGDYFDGNTAATETTQYSWAGTANASTSTATTTASLHQLEIAEASVNVKTGSIRRTLNASLSNKNLTASELYDLLSSEASILRVNVGFDWGGNTETTPVFTGRVSKASLSMSEASVNILAADYGYDIAQQTLIPAVTQTAGITRREAIAELVSAGFPGVTITDTATDTGTLISEQTWSGTRWDAIKQLATDGNMECFFAPDGRFIIRDIPTISTPVYMLRTSDGGTITSYSRERPLDKLYNAVVVKPKNTDGSQTWSQVYVEITDTASQRYKSKIGVRSIAVDNVSGTEAEATAVANAKLLQVQGRTETVALQAIANPALELGDTVQIIAQPWLDTPATAVTHIVDSYTFNIKDWSMSIATRNMGE